MFKWIKDKIKRLFLNQQPLSRIELLVSLSLILVAVYTLTPRFWEPCGESWKQWAAARILRETGGFPIFSHGPAYVLYLELFSFLKYPLSMKAEYLITHIFSYLAIFFMLRRLLPGIIALLLASAWIPAIATLEPGGAVAGIGFLALYLKEIKYPARTQEYLPLSLAAAALCHSAYLFFLIGNAFGEFVGRLRKGLSVLPIVRLTKENFFRFAGKAGLIIIISLTILFPSRRWDYNHGMMGQIYSPTPKKDALSMAFFQFGNWRYVMRTTPPSSWIGQDWYFTNEKAFGGAKTIFKAMLNKPETVGKNILENMMAARFPAIFLSGNYQGLLEPVFIVLSFIGIIGILSYSAGNNAYLFSILMGTLGVTGVLLLTSFTQRYTMTLLPVGLLMLASTGPGFQHLARILIEAMSYNKRRLMLIGISIFLILSGFFLNERFLTALFSSDGMLLPSTRLKIVLGDIILISFGSLLIISIIYWLRLIPLLTRFVKKDSLYLTNIAALASCVTIFLFTEINPYGNKLQLKGLLNGQGWLSGAKPMSILAAYPRLVSGLNQKTNILAMEDVWIRAFTKVDLDRAYHALNLPPFSDTSGRTEKLLNNLDQIWVSNLWSAGEPSVSAQYFLRYHLHVKPFLEKALAKGWRVEEVSGYGKIYKGPKLALK